jgi:hypothetical protein
VHRNPHNPALLSLRAEAPALDERQQSSPAPGLLSPRDAAPQRSLQRASS